MLFYHIDHSGSLKEGMTVAPYRLIDQHTDWPFDISMSVTETFCKMGLSNFGLRVLSPANSVETTNMQQFEFILEYVRCRFYPDLPSRLSSFYGMRDYISNFDRWKGRFGKDVSTFRIFECETDNLYSADASVLDHVQSAQSPSSAASAPCDNGGILAFPAARVRAAHQYWKSCAQITGVDSTSSDTGRAQCIRSLDELLAPGRVRVLRSVALHP